ncbi:INSIG domain protein [Aspergillus campestris IBT 28561]|uniref:INSIG domain protein n=1 Tax=Aspergillus campestris (strain IBT 28561) TaxID=1392248 RepID=A0A2I1CWY3_ASPC2|nr:INSIG domain protein [Aspergillus campestris IBT 28561]PKY02132.1 INSIG domain protein [Aspergillus campestris IBT 28561]
MSDEPRVLRPRPRRVFDVAPSNESSEAPTPAEPANPDLLAPKDAGSASVSRNGSIMNLTSSTLFGIYSPTAFEGVRDDNSPWGTEVHTPLSEHPPAIAPPESPDRLARQRTRSARLSQGLFRGVILPQTLKSACLVGFGIVYGFITIHLHENHWITPVKLDNTHSSGSWEYLVSWAVVGVALGNLLPWLDLFSEDVTRAKNDQETEDRTLSWVAVVRSVGAFVGVAFAMRRLPWESTTQASVTLALANPVLWYLIDRTKTGFLLSTTVGVAGMGIVLSLKPDLVPAATEASRATIPGLNATLRDYGLVSGVTQESIAVRTWVASVLFCACVCFGNIGRQLAIGSSRRDGLQA